MSTVTHPLLQHYAKLTEFLGAALGPDYEVALHDLTDKNRSIIAIANNHISGREIGAPLTNMALSILKDRRYEKTDYLLNYYGISVGGKDLRSNTFYIKQNGRLIGMLCINSSLSAVVQLQSALENYLRRKTRINIGDDSFSGDVLVDVGKIVDDGMCHLSGNPADMSPEAKKALVGNLSDRGIFLVRGAVAEVAKRLDVSEQTVYRYMKENQK